MLFVSLRDLQWRRRRFLIGVLAAGLVFALTLLMSGVSASFGTEIKHTVAAFGIDSWVVPTDVSGPFTSSHVFPAAEATKVATQAGAQGADPVLLMRGHLDEPDLEGRQRGRGPAGWGREPEAVERPRAARPERDGRRRRARPEGRIDRAIFGRTFTVVGRTNGLTYFAGVPVAFVPLADLQAGAVSGAPLANAIAVKGAITKPPAGYRVLTNEEVRSDLGRPMHQATQTIDFITLLLWIVAAGIIGSVLYLQAIERSRDFAVFKATGVTTRTLALGPRVPSDHAGVVRGARGLRARRSC